MITIYYDTKGSGVNNAEVLVMFKDFPLRGDIQKGHLIVLSRRVEEEQKMGTVRLLQGGAWRGPINLRDSADQEMTDTVLRAKQRMVNPDWHIAGPGKAVRFLKERGMALNIRALFIKIMDQLVQGVTEWDLVMNSEALYKLMFRGR
jgi:hypothetical protein